MNNKGIPRREIVKAISYSALALGTAIPWSLARAATMDEVEAMLAGNLWSAYLQNSPEFPRHPDRQAEQALQEIAAPVLASSTRTNLEWRIGLIPSTQVNAFTVGNGVIFVYDGLVDYCANEEELASVIAHEVGHVEHRHSIRRHYANEVLQSYGINPGWSSTELKKAIDELGYSAISPQLIFRSYTRLWEHEADAEIVRIFRQLGYSMASTYTFFRTLLEVHGASNPDTCLYSTHPLTEERIRRLRGLTRAFGAGHRKQDSEAFNYLKSSLNGRV